MTDIAVRRTQILALVDRFARKIRWVPDLRVPDRPAFRGLPEPIGPSPGPLQAKQGTICDRLLTAGGILDQAQCRPTPATPPPKSKGNFGPISGGREPVQQQNVVVMAEYRLRASRGPSKLQYAALALVLTSSQAYADSF